MTETAKTVYRTGTVAPATNPFEYGTVLYKITTTMYKLYKIHIISR